MAASPIDTSTGELRLIGGRCRGCSAVLFPYRERCPACAELDVERILLPNRGTLWTWTVQGFPPPSPPYAEGGEDFVPFAVGYVELADALRVESRLAGDPAHLAIGMELELVAAEIGGEALYAFAPVGGTA